MISKNELLKFAKKEFSTTLRVLKAFPAEAKSFRPHERSSDVIQLTSTFVFEIYLMRMYIIGAPIDRSVFQSYRPDGMDTIIKDFETETEQVITELQQLSEEDFQKEVSFGGRTFRADEFAMMMICDQIHHRGQLSVYVRMAGGKVPSIYGPSADESTTNL